MPAKNRLIGMLSALLMLAACSKPLPPDVAALYATLPDRVDYNLHVKPLLSDRCFACHGPDATKQKAGLRLDTPEGAFGDLPENKGLRAIVPGNADKSQVVFRILHTDPDVVMPTPESHLTLNAEEKALIVKWIEQGAEYKPHWSLVPPAVVAPPAVTRRAWPRNPIDQFVLAKLEANGLAPAPEANKEMLLRRLSLDLTGLPPTPAETDAFLADTSPDAYQKAVSRLLKSPHYGEQMATDWLDLARYADSHGYQDDGMRNVYPYRDWVIRAFNRNLTFDRFVTWQLAGDLLPSPHRDMLVAAAFNRNHPQSQEGGIIDEEYRVEYVADRANTFGKAFLGLTMECARCHDHKYDPISQKDYYSLFAFFNQNKESGEVPYNGEASPTVMLTPPETEAKLAAIRAEIAPLEKSLDPASPAYQPRFDAWLAAATKNPASVKTRNNGLLAHISFEGGNDSVYANAAGPAIRGRTSGDRDRRPRRVPGRSGTARQLLGDCGIVLESKHDENPDTRIRHYKGLNFERSQPFSVGLWFNPLKKGIKGPVFNRNNGEFEGFRGYDVSLNTDGTLTATFSYVWPANCIEIRTLDKLPVSEWTHIGLTYDGSSRAGGVRLFLNGVPARLRILTDHLTKSILHGEQRTNWDFVPFSIGKTIRASLADAQVDELQVYDRQLPALEMAVLAGRQGAVAEALQVPPARRTASQTAALREVYLSNFDAHYKAGQLAISQLRLKETRLLTDIPEVMTMQDLPPDQRRQTFVLARGAYDAPTQQAVRPGMASNILPFDRAKFPENRLGLARWLTHPQNPLFARVMVNRYWALLFGKGLVPTLEDFGNQGALPSHPELLDWLAVRFRESGWNLKALQRLMVSSATYRQASVAGRDALDKDPDNRLLSRAPSYRLSAETIRDNMLAASGLLVRKVGGPSVYPYQPAGLWEALATRNTTTYQQGHGADLYRRGLYTIWKRSSPPPSMLTFDSPDRYFCTARRQKTSTPLQALVLMNDPQYMEAARLLGERMMREGGTAPQARIAFACKALLARRPRPAETALLEKLYAEELADFRRRPARARHLFGTGEHPVDKTLNASELAACTLVATTLINFEETVVKR